MTPKTRERQRLLSQVTQVSETQETQNGKPNAVAIAFFVLRFLRGRLLSSSPLCETCEKPLLSFFQRHFRRLNAADCFKVRNLLY
jgi:hypothetical protein